MQVENRSKTFALRLPKTTRRQASDLANREGLSLNQFICLAVSEKIIRIEIDHSPAAKRARHAEESQFATRGLREL